MAVREGRRVEGSNSTLLLVSFSDVMVDTTPCVSCIIMLFVDVIFEF